ncbi:MAG: hypothetical protein J0G32_01595 [Alphaproteobacteria bacterium]|nr:hypothetical protein [Alphaproteobacteria bacterium]OJV15088.1 MAG: hypothetical protein BGO27_06590 [Alphaproteobacteria bacterium 33-17]
MSLDSSEKFREKIEQSHQNYPYKNLPKELKREVLRLLGDPKNGYKILDNFKDDSKMERL